MTLPPATGAQQRALTLCALCLGLLAAPLLGACGVQPEPRSALSTPQAALRFIGLRLAPTDGSAPKRTLPRAVQPNGAPDQGLGRACVVLLMESPAFRYTKENVLCEEWVIPPESKTGNRNAADLAASEAENFQPKSLVLSVPNPAQLSDTALQAIAQNR